MFERLLAAVAMTAACMGVATAQNPIAVGAGSYASFPPTYKASTPDHNGFSGTRIEGRVRYIDNPADGDDWSKWDDWNSWGEPGEPEDSGNITVLPDSLDGPNAPVDVYTTSGALVRRGVIRSEATRGLLPGLYIVGNRKIAVR